jgi:hypothetical protein
MKVKKHIAGTIKVDKALFQDVWLLEKKLMERAMLEATDYIKNEDLKNLYIQYPLKNIIHQ